MRTVAAMTTVAALALGGCAGDNPDNVPVYGQWQMVRTIDSVTLDGMTFAAAGLPPQMRRVEGTVSECGEPLYVDRNWQAQDIARRTGGKCELSSFSTDAATASAEGQCSMDHQGLDYSPIFHASSRFDATSHRDVVTMRGTLRVPGDSVPHVMEITAVQVGTRTGDC